MVSASATTAECIMLATTAHHVVKVLVVFPSALVRNSYKLPVQVWDNGRTNFVCVGNGQQFNALTRQCEPLLWHHTQTMCGTGARYYGHSGRGVCVCNDPNALFHPSFGGCNTNIGVPVVDYMCRNLYGSNDGYRGGRCACPNNRVWFRGSCLELGHDVITHIPNLPPELRCELQGKRLVGSDCQFLGGGYPGPGHYQNGPDKPIVCVRNSLVPNMGKEKIVLTQDRVLVTVKRAGGSRAAYTQSYHPQEYFRVRCEEYALDPGGARYWIEDVGTFKSGTPPYFGECHCGVGFESTFDEDLGYSYCVAKGVYPHGYSRCQWAAVCGEGFNLSVGANGRITASGELCMRDGTRVSIGIDRFH